MIKYAIIIGDGMADEPISELGGRTPLDFARTPCMDRLCAGGQIGLARTVPEGVEPGSDTAILSIFGYNPREYYSGRSPLEAAGCGVSLSPGQISLRANMAAIGGGCAFEQKTMISHSGGNINCDEALGLMDALLSTTEISLEMKKIGLELHPTPSFRHIAVISGYEKALGLTPPHDILGRNIGEYLKTDDRALSSLISFMKLSHELLDNHPINAARRERGLLAANCLWFWGAGSAVELPNFEKTHGKTAEAVSAVPLVRGIAKLAGVMADEIEGATGDIGTDYGAKVARALEALKERNLAIIHIEAPDECAHAGDMREKIRAIELIDERVVKPMSEGLRALGDFRLLVMPDHPTLLATRTHDASPVPFFIFDSRESKGCGYSFNESNASKGNRVDRGHELIGEFLSK